MATKKLVLPEFDIDFRVKEVEELLRFFEKKMYHNGLRISYLEASTSALNRPRNVLDEMGALQKSTQDFLVQYDFYKEKLGDLLKEKTIEVHNDEKYPDPS